MVSYTPVVMNAKEWKYKAEGNKHIVFCNKKGKVLRLKKSTKVCECNGVICQKCKGSNNELEELNYQRCVVMPLMKNCSACKCPSRVKVPSTFTDQLNEMVQTYRPAYRRHKSLIRSDFGILMEDKSLLHPKEAIGDYLANNVRSNVFCIEVKLKKGFMSNVDPAAKVQVCQFCALQMYRTFNDGKKGKLSYYCPIDLFSGNKSVMIDTLKELVECPQNTFRVFKNGDIVFSQELLDQLSLNDGNVTGNSLLEEVIQSFFTDHKACNGSSKSLCNLYHFFDLLCCALLAPLDDTPQKNLVLNNNNLTCKGKLFKAPFLSESNLTCSNNDEISSMKIPLDCNKSFVPSSSILGLVLSCQLLSNIDYSLLMNSYSSIIHSQDVRVISELDGQFDKQSWQNIGKIDTNANFDRFSMAKSRKNGKLAHRPPSSSADAQTLVQKYLVSKSFCDCSVMITMQDVSGHEVAIEKLLRAETKKTGGKSMLLLKSLNGFVFLVQISVVDIDPKPSSRIPLYCQQHEKLKIWCRDEMFAIL